MQMLTTLGGDIASAANGQEGPMQTQAATAICGGKSMSKSTTEFFQRNEIDGPLSPEQAAELLALAEGDTESFLSETGAAPEASTVQEGSVAVAAAQDATGATEAPATIEGQGELNGDNAAILAKDGKTLIPYTQLSDARERATIERQEKEHWQSVALERERKLEDLQRAADERAAQGQAATQADVNAQIAKEAINNGVDASVFGDMDEEGLARGVLELQSRANAPLLKKISELEAKLAPLEQQQQIQADQEHWNQVVARHPDAAAIANGTELTAWIDSQPSFVRDQMRAVVANGSTAATIELLDHFKSSAAVKTQPAPAETDAKAAAAAAIDKAAPAAPVSLSEVPGGTRGAVSVAESLSKLEGMDLVSALERLPQEQRDAYLNGNL